MKTYYSLGKFRVMLMDPSDRKTWWGIHGYLNKYHKDLKEEGWRLPSINEMSYLYDIFRLGVSGIRSGEYWTSNIHATGNLGEPTSCLVFCFYPSNGNVLNRIDNMPCIIRGTKSVKLPVILVKSI